MFFEDTIFYEKFFNKFTKSRYICTMEKQNS